MTQTTRAFQKSSRPERAGIRAGKFFIETGATTIIMGVLNITPDSFSDGGMFLDEDIAVAHAVKMAGEGADIIDIGGESTRPGAPDVPQDEEMRRVIPVIRRVAKEVRIPVSVDTRKPHVAEEALRVGASIINDVSTLRTGAGMADIAAKNRAAIILMHMKGEPADMQVDPRYEDLVAEIVCSLKESISVAIARGVDDDRIIIDPGIGFGKTAEHNLVILNRLDEFVQLGYPVCVGTSRKSFIAKTLDLKKEDSRFAGTLASCVISIMNGAKILRVHDVKEASQAARMADAVKASKG